MCLQKFPPASLQIFQNLPLDSYLSYLHVLAEIPPQFADFPKSATGQLPKLPTCACRNSSPSLQIFQNLPLDSYLSYLHVLAEIPHQFADFLKSATGQLPKVPTCACRNSPLGFADFPKSATGQLPKLPTCACRNSPPSLQIFQNLPLDSYLSYLHVLAEIPPPVCRFSKICHWTATYMCLQKFPPVCRFSKICHWTVT